MSTWATPITWANGAITATQMNTLRDELNFLKGFDDLISNSTTADTGNGVYLRIVRPAGSAGPAFQAFRAGESFPHFEVLAGGTLQWGDGAGAVDTFMARSGIGNLKLTALTTAQTLELDHMLVTDVGYIDMIKRAADPGAPGTNQFRLYSRDNGSGKTQACIKWGSGTVTVLATQP